MEWALVIGDVGSTAAVVDSLRSEGYAVMALGSDSALRVLTRDDGWSLIVVHHTEPSGEEDMTIEELDRALGRLRQIVGADRLREIGRLGVSFTPDTEDTSGSPPR